MSESFANLRRLADTFDEVSERPTSRRVERYALRLAEEIGGLAVPLLCRKLSDPNERVSSWAYYLLARMRGECVEPALRQLAAAAALDDDTRALALALLSGRGAPVPVARFRDVDALRERSVESFLATLAPPGETARAADLLLEQVRAADLAALVGEMIEVGGARLAPLVDELLLRRDLPVSCRPALHELRAELGLAARPRRRGSRVALVGARPDGAVAVVGVGRAAPRGPYRVIVAEIAGGALRSTRYRDDVADEDELASLRAGLARRGYALAAARLGDASRRLALAAATTRRLPRAYYLGRDLLGLHDEHATPLVAPVAAVAGAITKLHGGRLAAAHAAAARLVAAHPEDPAARTVLGSALLALGDAATAHRHFGAAARLAPGRPLHHWNAACAARRAGQLGACYLAMRDFLRRRDREEGGAARARAARRFTGEFERQIRASYPGASVTAFARAEEIFLRACDHLEAGRGAEAAGGFEAVVALVPSHWASWGNLGAAYRLLRRSADARRCLRRALELRPGYAAAERNLAALEQE